MTGRPVAEPRPRPLLALACLALAAVLWLPLLPKFFAGDVAAFRSDKALSPQSRALAERHLALWRDPVRRTAEVDKMRKSNAEWDFMGRTFLVLSLTSMALVEPERTAEVVAIADQILADTLEREATAGMFFFLMPYARAAPFVVQPPRSQFIDGEIALMLGCRLLLAPGTREAALLRGRVDGMVGRMRAAPTLCLESYPDECWTFCNAIALLAIRISDRLDGRDHGDFFRAWLAAAKAKLIHPATGLLVSSFKYDGTPLDGPEGSSIFLDAVCLAAIDPPFARDQYARAKRELSRDFFGIGYAQEWPASWTGRQDIDSGPILPGFNLSAGASGFALLGAAAFGDDEYLARLLTALNYGAFPVERNGALKYCASNQVGDSVLLFAAVCRPFFAQFAQGGSR